MLPILVLSTAMAGYGDAEAGHPGWSDRAVHFWTNAARVAPEAWEDDYSAGECSASDFQPDELVAKPGLLWNRGLAEAARTHTYDMERQGYFSHTSLDGTTWDARVRRFYAGGAIGENISRGYPSLRSAVLSGWMCSPGHRSNIMADLFDEIGTGYRNRYITQNFGGRGLDARATAAGLHLPESPVDEVQIAIDVWVTTSSLEQAVAVLDGVEHPMTLRAGVDGRGVYAATIATDGACHTWFAEVTAQGGAAVRYPEDGSYGWGPCDWDDPDARWVDWQGEPTDTDDPGDESEDPNGEPDDPLGAPDDPAEDFDCGGCATSQPQHLGLLFVLLTMIGVLGRRRTRARTR